MAMSQCLDDKNQSMYRKSCFHISCFYRIIIVWKKLLLQKRNIKGKGNNWLREKNPHTQQKADKEWRLKSRSSLTITKAAFLGQGMLGPELAIRCPVTVTEEGTSVLQLG